MTGRGESFPILRVEMWHGVLVAGFGAVLVPMGVVEPMSLLLGGLFMGLNFLLLGVGIRRVLAPFAGKGRVRSGVFLLLLKLVLFLALLGFFFFRFPLDALSFALGVSCLLAALVIQGLGERRAAAEVGD